MAAPDEYQAAYSMISWDGRATPDFPAGEARLIFVNAGRILRV
jgi:hypothetical protein